MEALSIKLQQLCRNPIHSTATSIWKPHPFNRNPWKHYPFNRILYIKTHPLNRTVHVETLSIQPQPPCANPNHSTSTSTPKTIHSTATAIWKPYPLNCNSYVETLSTQPQHLYGSPIHSTETRGNTTHSTASST